MTANKKRIPERRFKEFRDNGEWEKKKLGEVVSLKNGYTPSKSSREYWENGNISWFRMEDIRTNGHILSDSIQHITPQAVKGGGLFEANSIILSTTATIGEYALITVNFLANQRFTCITLKNQEKDNVGIKYLYYYMYFISKWCKRNTHSNTFEAVSTSDLKEAIVYLPSLPEQQKIAGCLSSLDELIGLEKEKLEKLKEYKKGLLQNLFPKENQKAPDLRFKEFLGSGEWEEKKLGEVVEKVTRNDPASDVPVMMISANNGFIEQSQRYAFNNAGKSLKKYILLEKGELAYNHGASKLRPYGSCFSLTTVEKARVPFVYHCFSANGQNAEFLSIELNGVNVENQLRKIVSSSARMDGLLNISFKEYMSVSIPLPSLPEQQKIADCLSSLDDLITQQTKKINDLKEHKKGLMQQLFPSEDIS